MRTYYENNKKTMASQNYIENYLREKDVIFITNIHHFVWTIFDYYFPGVPYYEIVDDLEVEKLTEFENKKILLFNDKKLELSTKKEYEKLLNGVLCEKQSSYMAGNEYVLYELERID